MLAAALLCSGGLTGCLNSTGDKDATSLSLRLSFEHRMDGEALAFDTLAYENAAGSRYSVSKLRYALSDFRFRDMDGKEIWRADTALLIDARDSSTWTARLSGIPIAHLHDFTFTFGLEGAANETGAQPRTEPWLNFAWPPAWGGGYHFLQLEGRFLDTAQTLGAYAAHIGSRALPSEGVDQQNHWQAGPFMAHVTPAEGLEITATVTLEPNAWFDGPEPYDFNDYTDAVMNNGPAQEKLKANGKAGAFSVGEFRLREAMP